jgi:hypothetical protein
MLVCNTTLPVSSLLEYLYSPFRFLGILFGPVLGTWRDSPYFDVFMHTPTYLQASALAKS